MQKGLLLLLFLLSFPALAAPPLSEDDRIRLEDRTTDRTDNLDSEDGFYVLLRNASTWKGDDFGGDAGAAIAPPPDYDFLNEKPEEARGNVYTIEGWFMVADRWPTLVNHSSEQLAVNTTWGEQVTRWTIVTEKDNPEATIIVMFHDPDAKMVAPEEGGRAPAYGSKVRIAARFHKLWMIRDTEGKPFNYATFIGGAAETVEEASTPATSTGGSGSRMTKILAAVVIVGGFFVAMRFLMRRTSSSGGGGTKLQDRLDDLRREREAHEQRADGGEGEDVADLPEDPVAALDMLREKHGTE